MRLTRCAAAACAGAALTFTIAAFPVAGQCQSLPAADSPSAPSASIAALPSELAVSGAAQSLTLADLAAPGQNWVRFHLAGGDDNSFESYLEQITNAYGHRTSDDHYYTAGQQIIIAGEPHLIVYKLAPNPDDYSKLFSSTSPGMIKPPPPLTASSKLALTLLNLRTAPGLVDIEPFNLQTTLAESQQQFKEASKAVQQAQQREQQAEQQITALSNARQIMLGMIQYTQDYDNKLPLTTSAAAFKNAVYPYVKSESTFIDPDTNTPFRYNSKLSKFPLSKINRPDIDVVLYSDQPNSQGNRIVGFADGRAKQITESTWQALKKSQHIP